MPTKKEKIQFFKEIEKIMIETKGDLNWIEAVCFYCSKNQIEIETAAQLVGDKLKKKLTEDATAKNYLKKSSKLKNV